MPEAAVGLVAEYLHRVAGPLAAMTDGELLAHYAETRDQAVFGLLLRRHGPMVLGVCRRALGPSADADDAFQATFIALSRAAGRISDNLPGWLFRVALRAAQRARRRRGAESVSDEVADRCDPLAGVEWAEVRRLLDEELDRLPTRWRSPLVLCYLDGLTRDEAARRLGWSVRTLHRRLDEGRNRLRARLTRRGLAPALLAATVLSASPSRSEPSAALLRETVRLATAGSSIPQTVQSLIPRMFMPGGWVMKAILATAALVGTMAIVIGVRQPSEAAPPVAVRAPATPEPPSDPPSANVLTKAPAEKPKPKDELAEKVEKAQKNAIEYLMKQQKDQGAGVWNWENDNLTFLQPGGSSCLAMLALLESGLKVDDPVIARGLKYIRSLEPKHTYVVSLQTQVLCKANQKEDAKLIKQNVQWLEDGAIRNGGRLDGWSYGGGGLGNRADHSNTRFAVAALYAAHKAGFPAAKLAIWQDVRDLFIQTALVDGGWGYTPELAKAAARAPSSLTMTGAGLACLAMADDVLQKPDKAATGATDNAWAYYRDHFQFENPPHTFYNFDVIATLGRITEKSNFGTKAKKIDWYPDGASWLIKNQKSDGLWQVSQAIDNFPVVSTAFALRFLASRPAE